MDNVSFPRGLKALLRKLHAKTGESVEIDAPRIVGPGRTEYCVTPNLTFQKRRIARSLSLNALVGGLIVRMTVHERCDGLDPKRWSAELADIERWCKARYGDSCELDAEIYVDPECGDDDDDEDESADAEDEGESAEDEDDA